MTKRRRARLTVLFEDQSHEIFIRRLLESAGHDTKTTFFVPRPHGGSGEQHVRELFSRELSALRRKHHNVFLVAMIDADNHTTLERRNSLAQCSPDEPVAVLIPKRHIETWVRWALGAAVNEGDDYKHSNPPLTSAEFKQAARHIAACAQDQTCPAGAPLSLVDALNEIRRILHA